MFTRILIVFALVFGLVAPAASVYAEDLRGDTTSVSAPAADTTKPATRPADTLADPAKKPAQAWDDLKAARKVGWPVAVFAALVMLARLAARLGSGVKWLAVLGRGKVAVVVGAAGALGAACYNAALDGGAWTATLMAGIVAIANYLDGDTKPKAAAS